MKKIISLVSLILCTLAILTIYFIKQDNNKYIAVYLDNIEGTSIPDRNSNYIIDKIICDNDAVGTWDNANWGLLVTNLSKRSNCKTYFRSKKDITITYDNNFSLNDIFHDTYDKDNMRFCCQANANLLYSNKEFKNNIFTITREKYSNDKLDRGIYFPSKKLLTPGKNYFIRYSFKSLKNSCANIGSEQGGVKRTCSNNDWQNISENFTATNSSIVSFVFYDWWLNDSNNTLYVGNLIMQEGEYDNYSTTILKEYDNLNNTLPTPTRENYTFLGWYTDPIEGEKISSETIVAEDTTYYAHWQYNESE